MNKVQTNAQIAERLENVADHGSGVPVPELLHEAAERLRDTMGTESSDDIELERDQLRAELGRRSDEYTHQIVAVAESDDFQVRLKLSYKVEPAVEDMSGLASDAIKLYRQAFEEDRMVKVTVVMGKWEPGEEDETVREGRGDE